MKKRSKLTKAHILEIKKLLSTEEYYQHEIAAIVGVNQGRVSEVKNGHYG